MTTSAFSLTASAPADFFKSRTVQKFGTCKIIDRTNSQTRTADGWAKIGGTTYLTTDLFPSTIDTSGEVTIFRNCN